MSKMKPNRYDEAVAEIKGMKLEGVEVQKEMNHADRYHNQVLLITSVPDRANMKFVHKTKRQSFNEVSFEIFKNEAEKNPEQKVVIFHSATLQRAIEAEEKATGGGKPEAKKLTKKEASDFKAFMVEADIAIEAGETAEAIEKVEEALKINPTDPTALAKLEVLKTA